MSYRTIFDAKISFQDTEAVFDFTGQLRPGETLSWAVVTAVVYSGQDPSSAPLISGVPRIEGAKVYQVLAGGVEGVVYELGCSGVTSTVRTLTAIGYLAVEGVLVW